MKNYYVKILKRSKKPVWLKIDSPQINQFDVLIGWDSEYRNKEYEIDLEKHTILEDSKENLESALKKIKKLDKKRTKKSLFNDIISHQLAVFSEEKNLYLEILVYLYRDGKFSKRITLGRILSIVFEELGYQWKDLKKEKKVLLTAHFSVAEFTSLNNRDRPNLIKVLNVINKTISSYNSFQWFIEKYDSFSKEAKSNKTVNSVRLEWRDTILLAPQEYKSLKTLSTTTTHKKLDLSEKEYINMVKLLETDETKFEEYAINDAIITLEFFCKFMDTYYRITEGLVKKIPLTAVGSSELHYLAILEKNSLERNEKKDYLKRKIFGLTHYNSTLKSLMLTSRQNDEGFVNRSYLGGRNNIARYYMKEFDGKENNKLFIDIDIKDAYSSAFGLIVLPKWNERTRRVITTGKYSKDLAQQYNTELPFTKMGFFETEFDFPEHVYEPILAQKTTWGLIFTKKGSTRATFPEMMEAERLGGIKEDAIKELVVYDEDLENGEVIYPFADYIKKMTEERNKWPKNSFENLLYKLQKNGLYGKTGQGIELREFFSLEGEKEHLKPSKITCAEYASHITGIIRTALGAMINEIENTEGCEVIHWTTDGLTFSIPWNYQSNITMKIEGENTNSLKLEELHPELMKKLNNLRIIRLLRKGAKKIGLNDENWLEIKGFGDKLESFTTRGNWMKWKDETTGLARGNLGTKIITTAEDFQRYAESDEITEVLIDNLMNIKEISEKECDLVVRYKVEKKLGQRSIYRQSFRQVNLGPDGKRRVLEDGLNTEAFKDIEEAAKYRRTIEYMTKEKIRKTPRNVIWQTEVAKEKKTRGSREDTIYRFLIAFLLQENMQSKLGGKQITYKEAAVKLNELKLFKKEVKIQDLKDWKHKRLLIKSIPKEGFWEIFNDFIRITKVAEFPEEDLEKYLF